MKKLIYFLVFTILGCQHALAQVATNGGSGLAATYTSLSNAITALNTATITSPVVITLTGNETSPAGGYIITATGTSVNTITIEGSSSTITAPTNHTVGNLYDAFFKIKGGDFITIQNFTMIENASNTVGINISERLTNTMTEFGVALFYATTTNGAQNCTIQNNTITLNRTYQNTFGIYSNSTHNDATSLTATSTAGSNSGLKIYGNTISNVNLGIVVVGPTGAADYNTGIDIGGSATVNGNTITNFGTGATTIAATSYPNIPLYLYGIFVKNSTGFNVSYNTITSNGSVVEAYFLYGINIASATNPPTGTFTNSVNNNTIALTHGSTAYIQGIVVESATGTATSTQHINNNNFTALGSTVSTSTDIIAINNVMPNLVNNVNGNTFTNITSNTTGWFTFISHSYTIPTGGSQTINGNSIVTAFRKTGAGGTVLIATGAGSSPNGTIHTFTNNNFSNITVTGATFITGVSNSDGTASGSATRTVTGNTFSNWTGGTGAITGISYSRIGGTTSTISNNTLTNISGQGAITGITISATANLATTLNVANNTISNLTSTGTGGTVRGLACTSASPTININGNEINTLSSTGASAVTALSIGGGATTNVFQNKIYNVSGANASSTVNGILISAGLNINTYNNLIGDLTATAASGTDVIRGISITSTTALSTHKIYGNTIYLNASSSGTNFGGSGIYHTVSGTSTTSALDLQNNIIINGLTPRGTGLAVAFRRSAGAATNLANYASTSNKNLFYAGTPGASNLIYSDGTSSAQTMANYQAGVFTAGTVAPRDANSFTEAWTSSNFVSVIGSSANYLQPASGFITQAESGGNTIALISPDYNNVVRPALGGTGYDIGAWEFSEQGQSPGLTVTYDSQNGSTIANGSTTTGGSIAASPGTPTRTGFIFNGWFEASTGGSAISFPYSHGQTANFTLYAQWTATYMITVTAGAGGSISPVTGLVNAGSNNTYTITPASGNLISDVTVDGTSATALTTGSYAAGGTYVFADVQGNHSISVTFALGCTNVGLASATATASSICATATTTLTYSGLTGTNASVTWWSNSNGTGTSYGAGTPSSSVGPGTYYAYATGDCGSAVSIQVVVSESTLSSTSIETITACGSQIWHGTTYTSSNNTATWTGTNAAGCDSVVTLNLTIKQPSTSTETASTCDSYVWQGTTYTSSNNTATWTGTNAVGCDSVVTLNLTIKQPSTSTETASACNSYVWHGTTYTSSNNTATWTGSNAVGCDSVVTLNLTINQPSTSTETVSACGSYVWHGTTYTSSNNTATWTGTNVVGCDSVVTLNLIITPQPAQPTLACYELATFNTTTCTWDVTGTQPSSIVTTTSACNSYTWSVNSTVYTQSGTYSYNTNCQDYTLNLTIKQAAASTTTVTASNSYIWNGTTYTSSGTYTWTGTNAVNCDSVATLILTINTNCITTTSTQTIAACSSYVWNGVTYTTSGTRTWSGTNAAGCDSTAILNLTISTSNVYPPFGCTQAVVSNVCSSRVYRYTASVRIVGTTYNWLLPTSIGGVSGVTVDSGDINSSRTILIRYTSNQAAFTTDSMKVRSFNGCYSKYTAVKLGNIKLAAPNAPSKIEVTSISANVCSNRTYRFIAPSLPTGVNGSTATILPATGYLWSLVGNLSEYASIDSGDENSQKILVTFTSNAAAVTGDSIKLQYLSSCGNSLPRAIKLSNTKLKAPAVPTLITITALQTNVCGARKYRYTAPNLPVASTTYGAATGYVWSLVGALSGTATIDSGEVNSQKIVVTFTSNAAAATGDSIRLYYTSDCGNGAKKASKLTNTFLGAPLAPAPITIQIKSDLCNARTYRYIATVLPLATNTIGAASGYLWTSPSGTVGSTGILDSGDVNSRIITVTYSSNAAAGIEDSIRLRYTSGCGEGKIKAQKLSNLVKNGCVPIAKNVSTSRTSNNLPTSMEVNVYPNPTTSQFNVQVKSSSTEEAVVRILDFTGRFIKSVKVSSNSNISFGSDLKAGAYMLEVKQGKDVKMIRVVKF
jgi:uncharacterized repeat protein (TIGR02543 family)